MVQSVGKIANAMYLKHLTITGFKSFAKKSELEFSSPITAIVGPNGSGKSNTAEAFRFVLGEQSPSKMRGKKGEDMIWGGSDQVTKSNRAGVAITLDNSKRVFALDFDEIILERVVHRDGQNEYLINGSTVRLKDVQEILAAANIGSSGHHIISQGEADRILSASARERREMIEDALGLKIYQFKKNEASKKLDRTRENIEKVESLRREVAPHLRFLVNQVKKLGRATELREQLRSATAEYLKREDVYLAKRQDDLQIKCKPLKSKLTKLEESLISAKETLETKKHDERHTRLMETESLLSGKRSERQNLLRQIGSLEGQISFLERRINTELEKSKNRSEVMISSNRLQEVLTAIEKQIEKALKQDDATYLKRALQDTIHSLRHFLTNATESGTTVTTESDEQELKTLKAQKTDLDDVLEKSEADEKVVEREYDTLRTSIEADQNESQQTEREVFRIVGEKRDLENELSRTEYELEVIYRERDEFKRELQEAVSLLGRSATDYTSYEIKSGDEDREKQRERRRELEKMKIRLEELGGTNSDLENEYKNVKERDDFLVREINDLNTSVEKLNQLIDELDAQLDERFSAGIEKISVEFSRFFALMFGGGTASLNKIQLKSRLRQDNNEDSEIEKTDGASKNEKIEEGLEVDVKLPNKRVRGLDMLSGGERALTSIALIFAMSQVNPPLFVILDETDAALDEANSRRYGDMIEALAKKSQLILITHNRETMSRAGILYGVTMSTDGVSKLLSVRLDDALAVAK